MNHNLPIYWRAGSWLLALLLFSPVIALVIEALAPAGELFDHLWNTVLTTYIANSVLLILGVGGAWSHSGYSCSLGDGQYPNSRKRPATVVAGFTTGYAILRYLPYIYTDLLEFAGPVQRFLRALTGWESAADYSFPEIRSLGGAIIVLALVLYPYLYLLARTAFLEQSKSQMLASRLLGCSPLQSFFRVTLPMARPAIITGHGSDGHGSPR